MVEGAPIGDTASWIQAGGLALFSGAVWFEIRAQRAALQQLAASLTALLERDRMASLPRSRRRKSKPAKAGA